MEVLAGAFVEPAEGLAVLGSEFPSDPNDRSRPGARRVEEHLAEVPVVSGLKLVLDHQDVHRGKASGQVSTTCTSQSLPGKNRAVKRNSRRTAGRDGNSG